MTGGSASLGLLCTCYCRANEGNTSEGVNSAVLQVLIPEEGCTAFFLGLPFETSASSEASDTS